MTALSATTFCVLRDGRAIVRDVSLSVNAGEIVALFGPSGAGKSTFFLGLLGELPTTGQVRLGGEDVSALRLWERSRRGLGYVPQGPSVLFDLTVRDNIRTFQALTGSALDVDAELAKVGLGHVTDRRAGDLSGGERRRLELLRALVAKPKVLLLDEPFAGLGPQDAQRISELLRTLRDTGVALLLSDHHADLALALADRAVLLVDGAVEVDLGTEAFRSSQRVHERYLSPHRSV